MKKQRFPVRLASFAFIAGLVFGQSPATLIDASRAGDRDEVKRLMDEGVSIDALDSSIYEYSALHWAVRSGDAQRITMLLGLGADPDVRGGWESRTPLHIAGDGCRTEAMILLLGARASINARDEDNWTPLHYVIRSRCYPGALLLIRSGADLNARTSKHKSSSALLMAKRYSTAIFNALREAGAR